MKKWWLYRTYYLYQLPRLERKLRVVIDWTLTLPFHRDIVQIDVTGSEAVSRAHYQMGEVIFQQRKLVRNFYTVLSGRVEVIHEEGGRLESPSSARVSFSRRYRVWRSSGTWPRFELSHRPTS